VGMGSFNSHIPCSYANAGVNKKTNGKKTKRKTFI